ncbi:hypothetical protein K440DRAFT_220228 [Wilcoxina mikolae CBS 423.85]|nr:hypothetical protein K440DRAFT_220228 [Wilcoxina mikolae CBS 423.85]
MDVFGPRIVHVFCFFLAHALAASPRSVVLHDNHRGNEGGGGGVNYQARLCRRPTTGPIRKNTAVIQSFRVHTMRRVD